MPIRKKVPWFLWPVMAVWNLLALILNITGRILAVILAVAFMIVGIALTITIDAAPIGIPFAVLGFLLMIRSIF